MCIYVYICHVTIAATRKAPPYDTSCACTGALDPAADLGILARAGEQVAADRAASRFLLLSLANSPPGDAIGLAMQVCMKMYTHNRCRRAQRSLSLSFFQVPVEKKT